MKMFDGIVKNLLQNIPREKKTIDLVLEGGAFNGSYMLGSLIVIKNLEKRGDLTIDRISGASIGSILAVVYKMDLLEFAIPFYKKVYLYLKKRNDLTSIATFCRELERRMPPDFYIQIQGKIYITFHDFKKGKKIVKSTYKNNTDIIDSLLKSSYIPFLCGKTCFYQNRYFDGLFPHIFPSILGKRVLYIDLLNAHYKVWNMFRVKKEKTNTERMMVGILDMYSLFFNQKNGETCYYLDEIKWLKQLNHIVKKWLESIVFWILWCVYFFQENVSLRIRKKSIHPYLYRIIQYCKIIFIQYFCI